MCYVYIYVCVCAEGVCVCQVNGRIRCGGNPGVSGRIRQRLEYSIVLERRVARECTYVCMETRFLKSVYIQCDYLFENTVMGFLPNCAKVHPSLIVRHIFMDVWLLCCEIRKCFVLISYCTANCDGLGLISHSIVCSMYWSTCVQGTVRG